MHYSSDPEIVRCIFHAAKSEKNVLGLSTRKKRSQLWKMSLGKNWDAADGQKDTLIRK